MNTVNNTKQNRAIIVGGSLSGLFVGNLLKRNGWLVDIYERSKHDLDSQGGGIVLQPDVVEVFKQIGLATNKIDLGVRSNNRTVINRDGSIQSKVLAPQTQTSWSLIYTNMREAFGNEHYHQGKNLVDVKMNHLDKTVTAKFNDDTSVTTDLLIGADGHGSSVRQILWPNNEPTYAGYLAWRGLIPESELTDLSKEQLHGDFAFASDLGSHMLGYLVPGAKNNIQNGHRMYNWVWYRTADDEQLRQIMTDRDGRYRGYSIPKGKLADQWVTHVKEEANVFLPPSFREVILNTQEPFAQAIRDLTVDHMVKDRVILIGDAAFIPRPHTGASTSKAASNTLDLVHALKLYPNDIDQALAVWQPQQISLGNQLFARGTSLGQHLMLDASPKKRFG